MKTHQKIGYHYWLAQQCFWAILIMGSSSSAGESNQAVCRVENQLAGSTNLGSGTLIDVTDDGQYGFVLTCAHLFSEGRGRVKARFADGSNHVATVLRIDRAADLAALEIVRPSTRPAAVSLATVTGHQYRACGFGPAGEFSCVVGPSLGGTASPGRVNLRLRGSVRSGDSGGGVFDTQDRLVGVIWGTAEGVTYASSGKPFERFLQSTLGRRYGSVVGGSVADASRSNASQSRRIANCPDGRCPLVPSQPRVLAPRETPSTDSARDCCLALRKRLEAVERELARRERGASNAAKPASDPRSLFSAPMLKRLVNHRWALLGTLCGAAFLGWLLSRARCRRSERLRSRLAEQEIQTAEKEATAAADASFPEKEKAETTTEFEFETSAPIERDDREARQLLRLSQLEGRDPLQDALAGRLALDRLDEVAEGGGADATFADKLRRELRERFNDVAPTKFEFTVNENTTTLAPSAN